eukprot:scaffold161340_cov30-Tisochrysis_lutea.AAC.2
MSASHLSRSLSPAPIAPEHVRRVFHTLDSDLDELVGLHDLLSFVHRANLPFSEETLRSMFVEANVTGDGYLNEDQLAKAVSGKFSYRKHNEDWLALFEAMPRSPSTGRITALQSRQPLRERITASFEKEREILTFTPTMHTNSSRAGSRTKSRSRNYTPSNAPAVFHGFEQLAAFDAAIEELERASEAEGWRERLLGEGAKPQPARRTYFGLHKQPWKPSIQRNVIPVRVDGEITRTGPHAAPMRWQATENQGPSNGIGLANSRTARLHDVHEGVKPFVTVFAKKPIQKEKAIMAQDKVEQAGKYVEPATRDVLSGYPGGYCFRVDRPPLDKPPFKTRLGNVWPKHEGRPPSDLHEEYFPTRLATTENLFPGGPPHYTVSAKFT